MSQTIDLKKLERKAWTSYFQDGLWDIYLGLLLPAMAVSDLLSDVGVPKAWYVAIYVTWLVLSMLVMWAGKKFITVPRMGRVKFGPKGKTRAKKAVLVGIISVLVLAVLFVIVRAMRSDPAEGLPMGLIFSAVYAVHMLVVFSLGAYFLDFNRLYLIGVMYALPVPVDILLDELAGIDLGFIAFAVPATVILLMGLVVLVRFLREYPLPAVEVSDGSS